MGLKARNRGLKARNRGLKARNRGLKAKQIENVLDLSNLSS